MIPKQALSTLPDGLRKPLLLEYRRVVENYLERRWLASELSGGRFCEIVYTILLGYSKQTYAAKPSKPADFVTACRNLEKEKGVPRSFQILIPRLLPVLYEVRNNRDVGHVGGDVNSNFMDATAVVSMTKWILAELIRVFHDLDVKEAQTITDFLAERTIPVIWNSGVTMRVMNPKIPWKEQVILLASEAKNPLPMSSLMKALDCDNKSYLKKLLRELHDSRMIEFETKSEMVQITPKGAQAAEKVISSLAAIPSQ